MIQSMSSPEQEKVTALFNKFGVEYMAGGDFAMRKYVDNKYYNNMQLWVKPTPDNFQKVQDAFSSVRRKLDVDEKAFTTENADSPLAKIGRGRKAVELYTGMPGMTAQDFNQVFANRKVLNAGDVPVPILNEKDLHKSIQKSTSIHQATDLQLLERAMPKLNQATAPRTNITSVVDWKEAAQTMDPHRVLKDLGFTHMPSKGLFGTSKSQTFERGDDRITVYPNPNTKPMFIDQMSGKKGDVIDLLNWQHNYDRKEVNRFVKDHFNGLPPTIQNANTASQRSAPVALPKMDDKAIAELQSQELKENYKLKSSLSNPDFLQSRGLTLNTIFRPEFFKQALNSMGWNSKEQKTVNIENTAFPMRNDHGITSMIIRNGNFKGFPEGERRDSVWLSNPPLTLNRDIKVGEGEKQVILPKGTEGTLVPNADKPGHFQFYYQDPAKSNKELSYNKLEVSGKSLERLTTVLNPLTVNRLIVTESPIDAMSFHQLSPPKAGESRMYLSTGGQPSEKQIAHINELVKKIEPAQLVLGNDNDKNGMRFNINMMGGIQHPATPPQNQFLARLTETGPNRKEELKPGQLPMGMYELKLFGAKDPLQMEKIAQKITENINRFTPKGEAPPARISFLNGSAGAGSEATISFPKNDRMLGAAQKQIEKIINENTVSPIMKIVKPVNKDFNEDLSQSQKDGNTNDYKLGKTPEKPSLKANISNLYQQITSYANSAFDALFGGVPGSLPRVPNTPKQEEKKKEKEEQKPLSPEHIKSAVGTQKKEGEAPEQVKPLLKNVAQPVAGLVNNSFDTLMGGAPGKVAGEKENQKKEEKKVEPGKSDEIKKDAAQSIHGATLVTKSLLDSLKEKTKQGQNNGIASPVAEITRPSAEVQQTEKRGSRIKM